jgi:hypothetical protein
MNCPVKFQPVLHRAAATLFEYRQQALYYTPQSGDTGSQE